MTEAQKNKIIKLENNRQHENPLLLEFCFPEVDSDFKEKMREKMCFLDKEVAEMRNKVKKIKGLMNRGEELKMLLNFPQIEVSTNGSLEQQNKNEDYTTYLKEIEKMDAVLKIKAAEEKKVRMSRLQMEEESKEILMELPNAQVSKAIKINSQEFINLLSESDREIADEKEESNLDDKQEIGKIKKRDNVEHSVGPKFILRNIQLAKCGRGTLSMTKDEELRVQNLLKDLEECDSNQEDSKYKQKGKYDEEIYALDEETQSKLSTIDKRLQDFTKKKILDTSPIRLTKLCSKKEEIDINENDKKDQSEKKKKKKKKTSRLREINNLLKYLNSETNEEIDPLPQEELEHLIEEAKESFGEFNEVEDKNEEQIKKNYVEVEKSVKPCYSKEELDEMVASAKSLMPKFKYRYE